MAIITFQPEFRPALPCVFGAKDYREFRATLVEMDRILTVTRLEDHLSMRRLDSHETSVSARQLSRHCRTLRLALRHNILLAITGLSFRELAQRLADSPLFQWFTHTGLVDAVHPVSKSTLERFEKLFDAEDVSKLVKPSIERIRANYGNPKSYTADRGFDAASSTLVLEELDIINGICPKSVSSMREKLDEEGFCLLQKRRGATEGRIGIFKNVYLGRPLRSKGFEHHKIRITWCILGHNLWKLATMAAQKRAQLDPEAIPKTA